MQLGFVSAILADQSLDQVAKFARIAGYDCVELMCWPVSQAERRYAGVTHVDVTHFSPAQADDVLATMHQADDLGDQSVMARHAGVHQIGVLDSSYVFNYEKNNVFDVCM